MKQTAYIICILVTGMFLFGCNKNQGEQATAPSTKTEAVQEDTQIDRDKIPETYQKAGQQISFDCSVTAPETVQLTKCTAEILPITSEQVKQYLIGNQTIVSQDTFSDTSYQYVLENNVYCTYNENVVVYMQPDIVEKVYGSLRLSCSDESNDSAYKQEELQSFSKSQAVDSLYEILSKFDIDTQELIQNIYVLDKDTLEQEFVAGDDMTEEVEFSTEDEGYYMLCRQTLQGLPVFIQSGGALTNDEPDNVPITAYYTQNGFQDIELRDLYTFHEGDEALELLSFYDVADKVEQYYEKLLTESTYQITRAVLYQYVKNGDDGNISVTPVWIFSGEEQYKDESGQEQSHYFQIEINAQNGEVYNIG